MKYLLLLAILTLSSCIVNPTKLVGLEAGLVQLNAINEIRNTSQLGLAKSTTWTSPEAKTVYLKAVQELQSNWVKVYEGTLKLIEEMKDSKKY